MPQANDIKNLLEQTYIPKHEYCPVEPRSFPHLDLTYYESLRAHLVNQGCIYLGDYQNITLLRITIHLPTFIRVLVTPDNATSIGVYHIKPKLWPRLLLLLLRIKVGRIIDFETELSNGGYIVTSNAAQASKLNPPPGFHMKYFPAETDPQLVFNAHRERLAGSLLANPQIAFTKMETAGQVFDMQRRMQAAKAAFRKSIGYVTADELQRMGADPATARSIAASMNPPQHPPTGA
jgi:hypothetical protein